MNKGELAESLLGNEATYDNALPQPWVNSVYDLLTMRKLENVLTYHDIIFGFVWLYDKQASIFGRPYPLTYKAKRILGIINKYWDRNNLY